MSLRVPCRGPLLALTLAAACSGGESQSPLAQGSDGTNPIVGPISSAPIPIGDLCPVFTSDLCVYLMQCNDAKYRDLDHCKAEMDCYGLSDLTASAANGSVVYDPSKVGECHARFLQDPCHFGFFLFTPDIYEVLSYCPGTIAPQVKVGGACLSSGECAEGYCLKTNGACPGTCTAWGQAGASCANGARCQEDLDCTNSICRAHPKPGDTCSGIGDCGPTVICIGDAGACRETLYCDPRTSTCAPGAALGEACGDVVPDAAGVQQIFCASNLFCDAPLGGSGTCRARGGAGAACTGIGSCQTDLHCAGYSTLDGGLGACVSVSASGGPCTFDSDCAGGLQCKGGACAALSALGEACGASTDCQAGLTCSSGKCAAARYPGDPCGDAGAACLYSLCKDGRCVDHAKVGAPCAADADCATGACRAGSCADTSVCQTR